MKQKIKIGSYLHDISLKKAEKQVRKIFSLATKSWPHFASIVLICGLVGAGGLKLTLSSFAATPTGTLDIITYVGGAVDGNEIGSVTVVTDQGGSGVQCSPASGTTDAGAGANHGHVHLTCPAAAGGGPRTYVFAGAARDGYSISGASPHAPGEVFHVSSGRITTLSIVMNDDTPPPAPAPAPAPDPTPATSVSSAPDGTLDIITYEGSANPGNEIGGVNVVTAAGGSNVTCTPVSGTTQEGAGTNHGHVHLTCPAAQNGGPRAYKLVGASRFNFVLSPNGPHPAGDTFHVTAGATTTLGVVMDRVSSLPPPSTPAPPTPSAPTAAPDGTLDIITYEGSPTAGNEIGGVVVATDQGGSGKQCTPTGGTTQEGTGANHGHIHLTCPAALDGGPRTYRFTGASRFNFVLSPNSPHPLNDTFHVSRDATTTLSLVMDRVSSLPPPSTPPPAPAPSHPLPPPPANQKTGSAQVTTYIYHTDGTKTRLGGVNLHIQSVNYDTTDSAHSCDNYNETSDSSGNASTNAQYGQVHFDNCWTGATGNGKVYQLSYTQLPAGYSFRSFHTSGTTFTSGATSNTDGLGEQFKIDPNANVKLEVWLNQNDESQTDLSNVKQVVTQTGTRYVPADDSVAAKQAAAALNLLTAGGSLDLADISSDETDADFVDESEDINPPSAPGGLAAVQDTSGSVSLTWQASVGDPADENVSYNIERTIKNSVADPESIGDTTTNLTALDTSDNLEYPQTYVYIVTASDDNDNTSDESTVEITTTPLYSNVTAVAPPDSTAADTTAADSAADATTDPTANADAAASDPTEIVSPDNHATLVIPDGATAQNLSCSVSATDSTGADLLPDIGTVVGSTAQPVCRDNAGDTVDSFTDDVSITLEEDNTDITSDTELLGFDGTDWEQIPLDTVDSTKTDSGQAATTASKGNLKFSGAKKIKGTSKTKFTVKSKHLMKLALVDRRANSPNATTPIVSLLLLVVLGAAARIIVRRRLAESFVQPYYNGELDFRASVSPDQPRPQQARPEAQTAPDPTPQVVTSQETPYVEQAMPAAEQPHFVVHPDLPKDKE